MGVRQSRGVNVAIKIISFPLIEINKKKMNKIVGLGLLMVLLVAMVAEGKSVADTNSDISAHASVNLVKEANVGCSPRHKPCHYAKECCSGVCHRINGFFGRICY